MYNFRKARTLSIIINTKYYLTANLYIVNNSRHAQFKSIFIISYY